MLLDTDETDTLKPPNHSETPIPLQVAFLPVSETSLLLRNPMITLSGVNMWKEDAKTPITVTRIISHHVPRGIGT